LLGADSADEGSEEVRLQDGTEPGVAHLKAGDDRVNGDELGERFRRRHKHRLHGTLYGCGMGGMRHSDFQGRRIYCPNHSANERDNSVVHARCPHQDEAIPAINPVIPGASEDF
jgi:hypothetical protein